MIAEISAGLGSLKTAKDFIQALNGIQTAAAVNDAKLTLQGLILDAQQGLFAAQELQASAAIRIHELEQQIAKLKDWSADQQRYELADTGQGSLAYRLKPDMANGEPPHWICPNCYQNGKKAIMKEETLAIGRTETLVCHPCGLDIVTSGVRRDQNPPRATSGRSR